MCDNGECRCGGRSRGMKERSCEEVAKDLSALEFCDKVIAGLRAAEAKHPHEGINLFETWDGNDEERLCGVRHANDACEELGNASWSKLLEEEVLEAQYELAKCSFAKARKELEHVAVVALRGWLWTREIERNAARAAGGRTT